MITSPMKTSDPLYALIASYGETGMSVLAMSEVFLGPYLTLALGDLSRQSKVTRYFRARDGSRIIPEDGGWPTTDPSMVYYVAKVEDNERLRIAEAVRTVLDDSRWPLEDEIKLLPSKIADGSYEAHAAAVAEAKRRRENCAICGAPGGMLQRASGRSRVICEEHQWDAWD